MELSEKTARILLIPLILLPVVSIVTTYRIFNDTIDEGIHIACGLQYLQEGEYTAEPQHPPLARIAVAILPHLFTNLSYTGHMHLWDDDWNGFGGAAYWESLTLARAGNLIFVVLMCVFVYLWAARLHGRFAGLVAVLIAGFSPSLLAHGTFATLDMAVAATLLMSAYFFWRWSQEPGWRYCVLSALTASLALMTKFSVLGFLPPIAMSYFLAARWKRYRSQGLQRDKVLQEALPRALVFFVIAATAIWAIYLFDAGPVAPSGQRYVSQFPAEGSLAQWIAEVFDSTPVPAPRFWQGIIDVIGHNHAGHPAYLLGEHSQYGWWYFFPVVVLVKTTIPLLLLAALGIVNAVRRTDKSWPYQVVYPVIPIAAVLLLSMMSNINIGVRHILPIYPFLAILASASFPGDHLRLERRQLIPILLIAWHAGESLWARPDYLPYFNEIARGREEQFLVDSNLDWGQDLARLGRYMQEKDLESIHLVYFGRTDPELMGVNTKPLSAGHSDAGWLAISVNRLIGIEGQPGRNPLAGREPVDRVGKSIWIYRLGRKGGQ